MNYKFYTKPQDTPISQPIPGREDEMKKNFAGGIVFKASPFVALNRWLLTGSMSNAFYQSKEEMTGDNIKLLKDCIAQHPSKVAELIFYASNKGISNHTPILALVYLSMGDFVAKKEFRKLFSHIIRNASHLYEFMSYVKALRGMGKTIHKAIRNWLEDKEAKELEYQFLKYQNRYNWTGRDVLRMIKPKSQDELKQLVYRWVVGKYTLINDYASSLERINAYENLKKVDYPESEIAVMIGAYNLTHEMIPANVKRTPKIWDALYQKMPLHATIRNLGNLTEKGIMSIENVDVLEKRLSIENLKRGRVHPLVLASAYKIYSMGGTLGRSKLMWRPISRINDIFEDAIENAFECLEPTGKQFYLALDVSASMRWASHMINNLWLLPGEVAAIMALATIKAEKNYFIGCFSNQFKPLPDIRKGMSFHDMNGVMRAQPFGGTNAGSAYQYAIDNKIYADVFVMYTDGESWLGGQPSQLLAKYRDKINPNAKAIYITLCAYGDHITLVDPKDDKSYDLAGFSSESIKLIQMISDGNV